MLSGKITSRSAVRLKFISPLKSPVKRLAFGIYNVPVTDLKRHAVLNHASVITCLIKGMSQLCLIGRAFGL